MSENNGDEFLPTGPLTDAENQAMRRMIRDFERAKWMRRQGKIWLTWIIGAPVAILAAWQASNSILEFVQRLLKG